MVEIVYKGLIYDSRGLRRSTVVIRNGIINEIYKGIVDIRSDIVLDYSYQKNIVAFPGFIDMHVHLRDFDYARKETIETGTRAAVHGGITVVGDMPNTSPRINNEEILYKRIELLKDRSYCDFYIYVEPSLERIYEIEKMIRNPYVAGIKLYPNKYFTLTYKVVFDILRKYNKLLIVHPEEYSMINDLEKSLTDHILKRDYRVEVTAINHIGLISEVNSFKNVHFTHITNPYSVLASKRYGFTVDTCPHYLIFSYERIINNCLYKVLPPIRSEFHRVPLLNMLISGSIDAVSSDHAPHSILEKICCSETCPPGINGIEVTAIFLGHLYSTGYLDLGKIYDLLVRNPSKILNLNNYGLFVKGIRGNISIINFNCNTCIEAGRLYTSAKYSVYDNMCFNSCVEATIIGGKLVYHRLRGVLDKPSPATLGSFRRV